MLRDFSKSTATMWQTGKQNLDLLVLFSAFSITESSTEGLGHHRKYSLKVSVQDN